MAGGCHPAPSLWKVDAGQITHIAGDGTAGTADGPAATAQFTNIWQVAEDGGDLYILDRQNRVAPPAESDWAIRKITAGQVTTIGHFKAPNTDITAFVLGQGHQRNLPPGTDGHKWSTGPDGWALNSDPPVYEHDGSKWWRFATGDELTSAINNTNAAVANLVSNLMPKSGGAFTGPITGTTATFTGTVGTGGSVLQPTTNAVNTAVGSNAGSTDPASTNQTATGSTAGRYNSGASQTALGVSAGYGNTGGSQTATGYSAGRDNTGASQTATGVVAGQGNTGDSQTATGVYAGQNNTGGDQTATGNSAGQGNSGGNQTATGYSAGANNTGANQTATGCSAQYRTRNHHRSHRQHRFGRRPRLLVRQGHHRHQRRHHHQPRRKRLVCRHGGRHPGSPRRGHHQTHRASGQPPQRHRVRGERLHRRRRRYRHRARRSRADTRARCRSAPRPVPRHPPRCASALTV